MESTNFFGALSSESYTGSRKENASEQGTGARSDSIGTETALAPAPTLAGRSDDLAEMPVASKQFRLGLRPAQTRSWCWLRARTSISGV
jgi:hypothetical protein